MSLGNHDTTNALHQHSKSLLSTLTRQHNTTTLRFRKAQSPDEEPVIPDPSLFNFDESAIADEAAPDFHRLPHPAQCATHLQLLEVLYVLRQRILASEEIDASFGIKPDRVTKVGRYGEEKTFKDETLWDRRQEKWLTFIEFAAVRFLVWRRRLSQFPDKMTEESADGHVRLKNLPPLDILMVWHSFMLNPRLLAENCQHEPLYRIRMPWRAVHASIHSRDWTFHHDEYDETQFETETNLPANLFNQFSEWNTLVSPSTQTLNTIRLETFVEKVDSTTEPGKPSKSASPSNPIVAYMGAFKDVDRDLAIQLRDAVVRQTEFVDKMNNHLWIRSPALEGTLRRATQRYSNFLRLLKLYPGRVIVPTLDIDLVWHTHQCTSGVYAKSMKAIVGRFINHDDTIAKPSLATSFDASRTFYRSHFGTEYHMCGCWDCEALLSAIEHAAATGGESFDMEAIAQKVLDQVTYHRAVEVAIRNRQPLPLLD